MSWAQQQEQSFTTPIQQPVQMPTCQIQANQNVFLQPNQSQLFSSRQPVANPLMYQQSPSFSNLIPGTPPMDQWQRFQNGSLQPQSQLVSFRQPGPNPLMYQQSPSLSNPIPGTLHEMELLLTLTAMRAIGLNHMGKSWLAALQAEICDSKFMDLAKLIHKLRSRKAKIYPSADEVFEWTKFYSFDEVKVVIVGQDPYPTPGHAHGLAFSVKDPAVMTPPSLGNIFIEILNDESLRRPESYDATQHPPSAYPIRKKNCNLTKWAEQGVILLNAILTYWDHRGETLDEGQEKDLRSMKELWIWFTKAVIDRISSTKKGVVFMLWGGEAQKMHQHIDGVHIVHDFKKGVYSTSWQSLSVKKDWTTRKFNEWGIDKNSKSPITVKFEEWKKNKDIEVPHLVLMSGHPSPNFGACKNFFGCKHFGKANLYLKLQEKKEIDWHI